MELLEDPKFKTTYRKSKIRVKQWESSFMEKYGRKPNKNDIKEANIKIRDAYKTYWTLKTRVLEETLTDITFDDEESNTSMSSLFSSPCAKVEPTNTSKLIPETLVQEQENILSENLATQKLVSLELETPPDNVNVKGVWGDHLSNKYKADSKKGKGLLVGRSTSFQLSQKMFKTSSFSKRNPRKSLSMTKIKSKSDLSATANVTIEESDGFDTELMESLYGEKLKIIQQETKIATQSLNTVQQLIDGRTSMSRTINQGWLERCGMVIPDISPGEPRRLSGVSDSGVESMESSIHSLKELPGSSAKKTDKSIISDEEDFVFNSDSEEERRSKRVRNLSKVSSDGNYFAKRPCLSDASFSYSQPLPPKPLFSLPLKEEKKVREPLELPTQEENLIPKKSINREEDKTQKVENLTSKEETDKLPKLKRTLSNRKGRRRIQDESKDDSDPEYSEEPKKTKRSTRASRAKKTVNDEDSPPKVRRTRKSVKKDQSPDKEKDSAVNDITFGIESLDVVPRLSMKVFGTGDLITDFSRVLACTEKIDESSAKEVKKSAMTAKERLEKKIASGELNDNYVRVNLKKKVFVRGKKSFNFSKFKKGQWKQRKKELASSAGSLDAADFAEKSGGACNLCGEMGHFARFCKARKGEELLPLEHVDDSSEFPTLEEAEDMSRRKALMAHCSRIDRLPKNPSQSTHGASEIDEEIDFPDWNEDVEVPEDQQIQSGCKIPEELIAKLLPPETGAVNPVFPVGPNNSLMKTPEAVFKVLKAFGHDSFRPGQEKAVMRILSGQSTLVTLSTGSGKSLCYQLPAFIYSQKSPCITLVISPLVSLMDDQITGIPSFLSAACLHTNQSEKVREKVMESVKQGKLNILLVSPEAVVAGEKSTGFGALLRQLPPIAFACIDEAHCISQWSHNFRPSYLMICRVLKEKLGVKTILGLTATATISTAQSIVNHLNIPDGLDGVISDTPMPRNLQLTVSRDEQRDRALVDLLRSERFEKCDSVIVYCTRREECMRIAGILRVSLQNPDNRESANVKISSLAEAYHAGLSAHRRKIVQKAFMSGETRIVVATVAFGMGINKSDIRSVIHYNMPPSFENYVQEIGRAGRDGLPAQCHLFISPRNDSDKWEIRRHVFANGVDRRTIRLLLQKIFVSCSCVSQKAKANGQRCSGHEVAIPIEETVQALDITEETISTLLCYLELHPKRFITVLSSAYVTARVSSYGGPKALKLAAQSSPPLAMAVARDMKKGKSHENSAFIEFPVIDVAAAIGWDSGVVKSHLKNLEWTTVAGKPKRSAISVRFSTLGLRVRAPGDLSDEEKDAALNALAERSQSQETQCLKQIEAIYSAVRKFSVPSIKGCLSINDDTEKKSEDLKEVIRAYFKTESVLADINTNLETKLANEGEVISDIRVLISSYRDTNFTARAVARIFHGIQSPNYPAMAWGRCRFWRSHLSSDFNLICQLAAKEILSMRVGRD